MIIKKKREFKRSQEFHDQVKNRWDEMFDLPQ